MPGLIVGGDFQVYYREMFANFSYFPPPAWNWILAAGLGVPGASLLWNLLVVQIPIIVLGNGLGFSWEIVERIGYLYPYIILSIVVPYFIFRKYFELPYAILALLVFSFNTYILMLVGGGQIFLSLAYVLAPAVFYFFTQLVDGKKPQIRDYCICALVFSFQVLFDLRIACATALLIVIYYALNIIFFGKSIKKILTLFPVFIAAGFLHFFWVLPTILVRENPLAAYGSEFTSPGVIKFLSFAKLENAMSLLQPNWPENIFGKAYFMRPEFLLIPIVAFSSLLFIKKVSAENKRLILFFATVGIIGAFLAKGASEPWGQAYIWLFEHIPGFNMFRDSTKWYVLVGLSYAFLIPYGVMNISKYIQSRIKIPNLVLIFTFVYLILLIRPAWMGELGGIFKSSITPGQYLELKEFLASGSAFYRTFWIPRTSTFSFYSHDRPTIMANDFTRLYSSSEIIKYLETSEARDVLQKVSVKYVIVPEDSDAKIFLKDRKYDESEYKKTIEGLGRIDWLAQKKVFGKIVIFEVPNPRDHFWSDSVGLKIRNTRINPSKYSVEVKNAEKGDILIFAENYNNMWTAISDKYSVGSTAYPVSSKTLNSFVLPREGNYSLVVYFKPQAYVNIGMVVSIATLLILFASLTILKKKR